MSDELTQHDTLGKALALVEHLRARIAALKEESVTLRARDLVAWDEIRHLRARIAELESQP